MLHWNLISIGTSNVILKCKFEWQRRIDSGITTVRKLYIFTLVKKSGMYIKNEYYAISVCDTQLSDKSTFLLKFLCL